MKNVRCYGTEPFEVAVVHGGPGAPGHMAPVARELASARGVLEPLQTAASVAGQIDELGAVLRANAGLPVTLIGFSWGAWLSWLLAANDPFCVRKLILVGSGPFDEACAERILDTRLSRLGPRGRREVESILEALKDPATRDQDGLMARVGTLLAGADAFNPLTLATEDLEVRYAVFQSVWSEAARLRRSGALLELGRQIQCPVVAIHGAYDPHPAEGVRGPLADVLKSFRFILLENCGHRPWIEAQARTEFFAILENELR